MKNSIGSKRGLALVGAVAVVYAAATLSVASADGSSGSGSGGSGSGGGGTGAAAQFNLKGKKPLDPPDLANYVVNRSAAIALGKALFWDQQVGSDGVTACATCHYNSGVDNRSMNTVAPGPNGAFEM